MSRMLDGREQGGSRRSGGGGYSGSQDSASDSVRRDAGIQELALGKLVGEAPEAHPTSILNVFMSRQRHSVEWVIEIT